MTIKEHLEYVQNLMVKAMDDGDIDAVIRLYAVKYLLYKDLIVEQQKEIIELRKVG